MEQKTSKVARIAAIIGIIILVALYLTALVFAIIDHPLSTPIIMSAIFCTFAIPIMIFALSYATKVLYKSKTDEAD